MTATPHLELRGGTKRFGATLALSDVDLVVRRGSVHALVGENGAGKSTLGKVVAGVHALDAGQLLVEGRPVELRSPRQALGLGLTIIAQELSLVPERSVVENVFLGLEDHRGPWVRRSAIRRRFDELVRSSGIVVPADTLVSSLTVGQQQKVEILRALARRAQVVVMDEPTARLGAEETEALRATVRRLAEGGTTVLFVSHFLDEVLSLADTITVMRDGRIVRTGPAAAEDHRSLIEGMTGRTMEASFPDTQPAPADAGEVLRVEGLRRRGSFEDVSFSVRAGEVVALAGLVGAGRSEVVRALYGADRADAGTVTLDGRVLRARNPAQAIARGISMIPESRKDQGLLMGRSVRENVSLPFLRGLSRGGLVQRGEERRRTGQLARDVGVKTASSESPVLDLSGGNQQKVLFARSLMRTPSLLIADEPTRGVDVGAKRTIYDLIADLAAQGVAVLMVSSELEEVLGLAHRVLVMRGGRLVSELAGDAATEASIMAAAFGTRTASASVPEPRGEH
jgi:rhamnose transport system ATP-binding protein